MSTLAALLRGGIAQAKQILGDGELLATVALWTCDDPVTRNPDGTPIRTTRTEYSALVSSNNRLIRTPTGTEFVATTKVTFLEPVTVTANDAVELPDGSIPEYQALGEAVLPSDGAGVLLASVYCG